MLLVRHSPTMASPLCLLGFAPLPFDAGHDHTASGARTWQFARALAEARPSLDLLLVDGDPGSPTSARVAELSRGAIRVHPVPRVEAEIGSELRRRIDRIAPEAIIGATSFGSFLLARTLHPAPLWVDLYGDPISEAQALATLLGSDSPQSDGMWLASWCLRRGDRFSAVSPDHRLALLGQLGLGGRLNRANTGDRLVEVIPPSFDPLPLEEPLCCVPFTILFSGSFNSWTDGETLARAVELVLSVEPGARFVATGGPIPGFLDSPWQAFVERMESARSTWQERVLLLGRIEAAALASIERSASCGVVAELPLVERELGSATRCLAWMAHGKPVVLTDQSELGRAVRSERLGLVYRPGDPASLAEALLQLARSPALAQELGLRARRWIEEHGSLEGTTAPLRRWATAPRLAADRADGSARRWAEWQPTMLRDQLHLEKGG